jgi:RNase P subunit RPR2
MMPQLFFEREDKMNFAELRQQVEREHERTGDAIMELEHKLDLAEQAAQRWEDILRMGNSRNKQVRMWERNYIAAMEKVKRLNDLTEIARTIICKHCGYYMDDPAHVQHPYTEHGETSYHCEIAGVSSNDYVPF